MRKVIIILGLWIGMGMASPFWLSAGLQADFLSQGLSFRIFDKTGMGLHLVGHWFHRHGEYRDEYREYRACGELRVEKMFRMPQRIRPYVGLGIGGSYNYDRFVGCAGVFGVDVIFMQGRGSRDGHPSHGLSFNVEMMVGIFADYWGPAAGAGIHYNW